MDKKRPTTVMLSRENWKALKIQAAQKDCTLGELINDIIQRHILQ